MNVLILDEEQIDELQQLNESGVATRRLQARELEDGRFALNADLLEDCGPGQTWEHYADLLQALEEDEVETTDFAD